MCLWVDGILAEVITCLGVLLATAWSTLLERKLLAGAQRRKGPNNVSLNGVAQPLADCLNLLINNQVTPSRSNSLPFFLIPCLALIISIILWQVWPQPCKTFWLNYGGLVYVCVASFHIYAVVLAGWAANSMYSILGALRGVAQTVSYELPYNVILLTLYTWHGGYNLVSLQSNSYLFIFFGSRLVFPLWVILMLCELHRTPFDLTEAESELVSGYNTDYGAVGFIQLFISEYANIVFAGQFSALLWFWPISWVWCLLMGGFITAFILFCRAVFPRCRYDLLIEVCWKVVLPYILVWFLLSVFFILFI